jgi:hypothetical protein
MKLSICLFSVLFMLLILSCNNNSADKRLNDNSLGNKITQQKDGTVSLKVEKASRYSDALNPSDNTADWDIVISRPGRFKVWLSSATKDTSLLNYGSSVRISLMDEFLVADPSCDKVILNSSDVAYPYFRADSYMGSVYIPEPGEYNLQVISDRIKPSGADRLNQEIPADTRLISVKLTPEMR